MSRKNDEAQEDGALAKQIVREVIEEMAAEQGVSIQVMRELIFNKELRAEGCRPCQPAGPAGYLQGSVSDG